MGRYICGGSVLRLTGHVAAVRPGQMVEHDFSVNGPEGDHGPHREAALLAAGALRLPPGEETELRRAARAATDAQPTDVTDPPAPDVAAIAESEQLPRGGRRRRTQE